MGGEEGLLVADLYCILHALHDGCDGGHESHDDAGLHVSLCSCCVALNDGAVFAAGSAYVTVTSGHIGIAGTAITSVADATEGAMNAASDLKQKGQTRDRAG